MIENIEATETDELLEVTDNEFLRQFECCIDENLARIEYSAQERKIFLTKFRMPQEMLDMGYAEPFMEAVFEEIKTRNISLVPTSPEIASFMRKNRERYRELLPVGINI